MNKRVITTCIGLLALAAAALPATVSASPVINTSKGGTAVAVGTKVKGTSVGIPKFKNDVASNTLSECSTGILTGEVVKNNAVEFEVTTTTATLFGEGKEANGMKQCNSTFGGELTPTTNGGGVDGENVENGTPWCIKSGANDTFTLRGNSCDKAARKITFIFDTTAAGECKYERPVGEPIKGTFTTVGTGDAILTMVAGANTTFDGEAGDGILCPATGTLEMSFTLEEDAQIAEPFYIS